MVIASNHFWYAFDDVLPSVSRTDLASGESRQVKEPDGEGPDEGIGGAANLRGGRVAIPEQKATSRKGRNEGQSIIEIYSLHNTVQ